MADKKDDVKLPENPSGELLLALQNRINDLEAKLQKAEKEQAGKTWVDMPTLDNRVSELRAELKELRAVKKEAIAEVKPTVAVPVVQKSEESAGTFFRRLFALDE